MRFRKSGCFPAFSSYSIAPNEKRKQSLKSFKASTLFLPLERCFSLFWCNLLLPNIYWFFAIYPNDMQIRYSLSLRCLKYIRNYNWNSDQKLAIYDQGDKAYRLIAKICVTKITPQFSASVYLLWINLPDQSHLENCYNNGFILYSF